MIRESVNGPTRLAVYVWRVDVRTLFDEVEDGLVLRLHVQPGAGRTQVTGTFGTALKVKVAAPPEAGRANEAVIKLLAESLDVDAKTIELQAGDKSRSKTVLVRGAAADAGQDAGGPAGRRPPAGPGHAPARVTRAGQPAPAI